MESVSAVCAYARGGHYVVGAHAVNWNPPLEGANTALAMFGLREHPFAPTADPAYFYATREHKECLFRLWDSVDNRHGIAVVLGNYGTGKTTLLRKLMTGMAADPERYNTTVIGSPVPSWTTFALLESITAQFCVKPAERAFVAHMEALNQFLLQNRNRINTLIIDDAQNLNKRGQLELLRLVQNLETAQHKLLNLVLFAQLEWTKVLRAAPNFEQRINLTYTLSELQPDELRRFIDFRLSNASDAGGPKVEFTNEAVAAIHQHSGGNPRVTVTLCRNALVVAGKLRSHRITEEIVLHTIKKTTAFGVERLPAQTQSASKREAETSNARPFPGAPLGRRVQDRRASEILLRSARDRSDQ